MHNKHILFLFICFLGLTGCKSIKNTKRSVEPNQAAVLSEKDKLDFAYLFYDAMKDKILGNYPSSRQKFQQAIRINPRAAAAHYELSQLAIVEERFDQAEISAQSAVRFDNQNNWYKLALAGIYERTGKISKMIGLLEDLVKSEPYNSEYEIALASAYVQADRYEAAIEIFNKLEADFGISEELAVQKKELYMRMKKPEKAIEEIKKLIAAFPEEVGYHGILAEIYESIDKPQEAFAEFEEILRLEPQNPNVYFSLADFYRDQGNKEKSFESLKSAFRNPTADFKLKAHVLASYFGITEKYPELKSQAIELCEILIGVHPEEAQAHAIYGDFLLRDAKFEQAKTEYEQVLQSDKSVFSVWSQLFFLCSEMNDYKQMYALSKEAIELFPNQPTVFLYNGMASMQLKNYQNAIEVFKQGVELTAGNDELLSQFYASLGDCYNFLTNYEKSNESYEKALKLDSKNAYVLNNYAYYLSLRKENLDRAKELALKCNELNPGNPSYQDTYAWVLYQAGNYEDANTWQDKALASGGMKNPTLIEHKGDILWKLGKTADALDYWNRAKELGATGKIDQKISQRKLIE
jgi:tetratricopeptide (TPR) repeat protein